MFRSICGGAGPPRLDVASRFKQAYGSKVRNPFRCRPLAGNKTPSSGRTTHTCPLAAIGLTLVLPKPAKTIDYAQGRSIQVPVRERSRTLLGITSSQSRRGLTALQHEASFMRERDNMFERKRLAATLVLLTVVGLACVAAPCPASAKEESGWFGRWVYKRWENVGHAGKRPDSVRVRVKIDAVDGEGYPIEEFPVYESSTQDYLSAEGPDGVVGTDDDWTLVLSKDDSPQWRVCIQIRTTSSEDEKMVVNSIEVEELDVPDGYESSVEKDLVSGGHDGGSIVVTNSYVPSEPVDPDGPDDPADPSEHNEPENPEKPANPDDPADPGEHGEPAQPVGPDVPEQNTPPAATAAQGTERPSESDGAALPETGDSAPYIALGGLGLSVAAAGAVLMHRRS